MTRATVAVALCLLACLPTGPLCARAEEKYDRDVDEMLRRAMQEQPPTAEDQRAAARALRDWKLSEQNAPASGDQRIGELLRALAEGRTPPPELVPVAGDLHHDYLTPEGRERRARAAGFTWESRAGGARTEPYPPEGSWLLLGVCVLVMVGGVAAWALLRRRNRPDHRIYYS